MARIEDAWRRYRAAEVEMESAGVELRVAVTERMRALRSVPLVEKADQVAIVSHVCRVVAAWYGCGVEDIVGRQRTSELVVPRQVAMALSREMSGATFHALGRFFKRDHATIVYAVRVMANRCETEPKFRDSFEALRGLCRGGP